MNDLNEIQSILKTEFAAFETSDSGILNFTICGNLKCQKEIVYGLLCFCAMDLYMELKILYQLVHMRIRTIQN